MLLEKQIEIEAQVKEQGKTLDHHDNITSYTWFNAKGEAERFLDVKCLHGNAKVNAYKLQGMGLKPGT
tara:strand:- start:314 stop:517 length:204 start_codon:yes stop_codon:yes gene_type:complete